VDTQSELHLARRIGLAGDPDSRATESNDVGQAILPAAAFQAAFSDVRESSIPANAG
jgi:hypothetical protein